jgi:hypothetical protein
MQARIKIISLKEGHCFAVSSSRAAHARTHAAHTHASTDARRRCLVPSLPSAFTPSEPLAIASTAVLRRTQSGGCRRSKRSALIVQTVAARA